MWLIDLVASSGNKAYYIQQTHYIQDNRRLWPHSDILPALAVNIDRTLKHQNTTEGFDYYFIIFQTINDTIANLEGAFFCFGINVTWD